jgi:DNA repair protein RecO (recombination protein O)
MSPTYKATGINLKSMPLGESDRLLTILTQEFGLIRVVAPGCRKPHSKLGGRSALFVVNDLLLSKGRTLDKIIQAETLESYPGLSQDLLKLTASQYLAELVLLQALSDQSQAALFALLNEHLKRLEYPGDSPLIATPRSQILAHLSHAIFQLLVLDGIAPQVHTCCVTQKTLLPPHKVSEQRVGFSPALGGTMIVSELTAIATASSRSWELNGSVVRERSGAFYPKPSSSHLWVESSLTALELLLLQQLAEARLPQSLTIPQELQPMIVPNRLEHAWFRVENLLRQYLQFYFERPIRSATLIDTCFKP